MTLTVGQNEEHLSKSFISTGQLPASTIIQDLVDDAYARYCSVEDGKNASYYPALADVPRDLFGICITHVNGREFTAGDVDYEFTIMSIAKPFTLALVCQALGGDLVREKVGLNATGLPFNSIAAIELHPDRKTNPMVNPGALATASLVPGETAEDKWRFIREGLSRFAGRELVLNEEVYASAKTDSKGQFVLDNPVEIGVAHSWLIGATGYKPILEEDWVLEEGTEDPLVPNIMLVKK